MDLFKFHSCNLDFHIFYPFSCCIIAICSWALGSFLIISQVSSCLSQKLHTLFHFGCVTVLGPRSCLCTHTHAFLHILALELWLFCGLTEDFHIHVFLIPAPVCSCLCEAHSCLVWMVSIVHHTPGVCDGMFSTSLNVLSWEPFSSDWQIVNKGTLHLFCKAVDIFWNLTVTVISLAILVKKRKLELRKQ